MVYIPRATVIAGRLLLHALLLAPELFNTETIEPGAEEAPRGMHRNNVAQSRAEAGHLELLQAPPFREG